MELIKEYSLDAAAKNILFENSIEGFGGGS